MGKILNLPASDGSELLGSVADEFRQGFAELSTRAEEVLSGKSFIFSKYGREVYPYYSWETDATEAPGCIISIKEGRPVASVDSTCILLGETREGSLYAARVGAGISIGGSLQKIIRVGPALVFLSKLGFSGLKTDLSANLLNALLSDHVMAERIIRNTIERRAVESLLASDREVIVMADGSLKHPLGLFPIRLPQMKNTGTSLVGFSKSSSLIFSEAATTAVSRARTPAFYKLDDGPVGTVLAKFSPGGLVFRLDLAHPKEPVEAILGRILWNDVFSAGYPESLKIAHHLAVFTRAEDAALRALVTRRFRLRELPTFDLRRVTLGTLGRGV